MQNAIATTTLKLCEIRSKATHKFVMTLMRSLHHFAGDAAHPVLRIPTIGELSPEIIVSNSGRHSNQRVQVGLESLSGSDAHMS